MGASAAQEDMLVVERKAGLDLLECVFGLAEGDEGRGTGEALTGRVRLEVADLLQVLADPEANGAI